MKAVICGAGIAGLTLGWWLGRDGWDVVIVEKAPGLRDEGYMIDFFGAGYGVAERMDLVPRLKQVAYHVPEVCWIDSDERVISCLDYDAMRELLNGRLLSLMRGDLERALFDVRPPAVDIRFGYSVAEIHATSPKAEMTLTSGERMQADLLVGADGVHSTVRKSVFGNAEDSGFRYLGMQTAAFIFEDAAVRGQLDRVKLLTVPGRQICFYPIRGNRVAAFAVHLAPEHTRPSSPVAKIQRVYGDLGWIVPDALRHAAKLPDIYYDDVAQIVMPRWSEGCVTLVGDACHAVSLLAGQGASMAMGGACALAEALRKESSVEAGLARYEAELRPSVERQQAAGRRMANWFVPASQWRLMLRNLTLKLMRVPGLNRLMLRSVTSGADI